MFAFEVASMKVRNHSAYIAKISLLSAIAAVMLLIETPLPFMPAFLKLDLSEIPALLGAFSLGPLAAVYICLIKNMLHVSSSQTGGVGELANFLIGSAFVIPAGLLYKRMKSRRGALIGLTAGIVFMTIVASLLNYWVLIPLYLIILGIPQEAIIAMGHSANSLIVDLPTFIAYGIVPFNLVKGILLALITMVIYKRVSAILHR